MYMIDEEGEITTREVKAKFVNGKPEALEALYVMKSVAEWERFMRFMERYAEQSGLGFQKS
jgi:photosystem II 13kDa protein